MLVVGRSGSGKSVFVTTLLKAVSGHRHILIIDSKGEDLFQDIPDSTVITQAHKIPKWNMRRHSTLIYRPDGAEAFNPEILDRVCLWSYRTGNLVTYIDELSAFGSAHSAHKLPGLINLLARGRARNRGGRVIHSPLWMSSQRPRSIPVQSYTESNRIVVFDLVHEGDRKAISGDTHPALKEPPRERFGFWIYDRKFREPMQFGPLKIGEK